MSNGKKLYKQISYNILEFKQNIPAKGSLLSLDIGDRRIGIAKCDEDKLISSNLKTLIRKKFSSDIIIIEEIIKDNSIKGIVIGLPLNLEGKPSKKSQSVTRLTKEIYSYLNIPILLWDERNSTIAVEKFFIQEVNISREKRKKIIDSSAAQWILEGVIKTLKNKN